jgi:3-oxoacyl-[acyl-carrier protein] reductase
MDFGISGKRALVTGGASGIGKAIAMDLVKEGVKVIITSRKKEIMEKTFQELGGKDRGHMAVQIDLAEESAPMKLAEKVWKDFGQLDIVVNNIGDTLGILNPYCPISDWRKIFRLIVEVAVEINNLFIPHMKKQDWGRIVNISAGASMENSGPVPYCSCKAALTAYSRSMGRILAIETSNVVMSSVLPGVILTEEGHWQKIIKEKPEHAEKYLKDRCPAGRFGTPDEISPMVVLLCSNRATFCQGSIVPVDAGQARHFFHVRGVGN